MKHIFGIIWRYIGDIFVEDFWDNISIPKLEVRNLTKHYRVDFPNIELDAVFVWAQYSDIENILESYKYHSERTHVHLFVQILSKILQEQDIRDVIIITVPMHWSRYGLRGFDHMDYIVKKLSRDMDIPYLQPLRTSFSKRQSKLSRKKRLENRKNHFTIDVSITLPRRVILIDDVISTGATAHECAKVLKRHGIEEVIGVFLASSAQ